MAGREPQSRWPFVDDGAVVLHPHASYIGNMLNWFCFAYLVMLV
jgi:hypothetical protein